MRDMQNYLSHHGVVGMHWGIRRYQPYGEGGYNPKNAGVFKSKRSTKKAIAKAYKQYYGRKSLLSTPAVIGPNTDKIVKEYHTQRNKLQSVRDSKKEYDRIDRLYEDGRAEEYEKELHRYEHSERHPSKAQDTLDLARVYSKKLNDATLKDLGVDDISSGRKWLKTYGLDWNATGNYHAMRRGRSNTYIA